MACFGLCILLAIEPPYTWGRYPITDATRYHDGAALSVGSSSLGWNNVLELTFACMLIIDVATAFACTTPRAFCRSYSLYALFVLVILSDAVVSSVFAGLYGIMWFRYSRVLRPLLFPFINRTSGHMV